MNGQAEDEWASRCVLGRRRQLQQLHRQQPRRADASYVQRLSVQLPGGQWRARADGDDADEDVLRLVIHVEEDGLDEPDARGSLRRKASWHSSDETRRRTRRMLKEIGRQRSASLENCARIKLSSVSAVVHASHFIISVDSIRIFKNP